MTNQEVVDFVREGVIKDKSLEAICEEMMDHCLADSSNSSGLGYDNMSVMIIGILNGKTEKEWYETIQGKSNTGNNTGNKTIQDTKSTTPAISSTPTTTAKDSTTPAKENTTTTTTSKKD
jgi:hypothetical protein